MCGSDHSCGVCMSVCAKVVVCVVWTSGVRYSIGVYVDRG